MLETWCQDYDAHSEADLHEFCERHQIGWCSKCDGACPDCKTNRALGEPDDCDSYEDEL